jgi:hypothetical protein
MVNRYNQEKQRTKKANVDQKNSRKLPQPLTTSVGHLVLGGGMAVGGGEFEGKECWLGSAPGRDG